MNKEKAIGSTLKVSQFMGCETRSSWHLRVIQAEMLFTNLVVDITLSADDHARLLCWCFFPQKSNCKGPYALHSKSDYYA